MRSDAYLIAHSKGWDAANYADAYGSSDDESWAMPACPPEYADTIESWRSGWEDGRDAFREADDDPTTADGRIVIQSLALCDRCAYYAEAGACEGCEECAIGDDPEACTRREQTFDSRFSRDSVVVGERDHGGAFTYGRMFGGETCDGCGEPFANDVTHAANVQTEPDPQSWAMREQAQRFFGVTDQNG